MPMTMLRRDPFARQELFRETVPVEKRRDCDWCGSAQGRFTYYWESDWGRQARIPGRFCGISCMRAFNQ